MAIPTPIAQRGTSGAHVPLRSTGYTATGGGGRSAPDPDEFRAGVTISPDPEYAQADQFEDQSIVL